MRCFNHSSPFAFVNNLSKFSLKMLEKDQHIQLKTFIDGMFKKIDTIYNDDMFENIDDIKTKALNYIAPVNKHIYLTDGDFQFPQCLVMLYNCFSDYITIKPRQVIEQINSDTEILVAAWIIKNITPIFQDEYSWILEQAGKDFASLIEPYVSFDLSRGRPWQYGDELYARLAEQAAKHDNMYLLDIVYNMRGHHCYIPYEEAIKNGNSDIFQILYNQELELRNNPTKIEEVCCKWCKRFYTESISYDRHSRWVKWASETEDPDLLTLVRNSNELKKYEIH